MRSQTSRKAELFARALRMVILGVFALFAAISVLSLHPTPTFAATSSTLNFQARLETAGGAIVPDGNYNVEFKLYTTSTVTGTPDQGACTYNGGTADPNCLWVETRTSTNQVRVVNGYLTVNLGSVNAFPGTVNWNQQLYLTMRIGGTSGTPSWDAEMSPRIQLTAVPYAFQAGALSATSGSNIGTLSFGSITGTDSITLPDAAGTVCLQNASACGFATGSGTAFLQGGNSFGAQAEFGTNDNFNLAFRTNNADRLILNTSGALTFQQAGVLRSLSATTGTSLTIQGGQSTGSGNNGGNLILQGGAATGGGGATTGSVIVEANGSDSTTAFQVQNASGAGVLTVNTSNLRVSVGSVGTATGQLYVSGAVPSAILGTVTTGTAFRQPYVQGRYMYVVDQSANTLQIYDVSNPASPASISSTSTGASTGPQSVYVQGRYAYVTDITSGALQVFDVSNPFSPSLVGSVTTNSGTQALYVQGRYAYVVNNTANSMQIVDVSNPAHPAVVSTLTSGLSGSGPTKIVVQGRYAYVLGGTSSDIYTIDVSNVISPSVVGSAIGPLSSPGGIDIKGGYLYVTLSSSLVIYNVENPGSAVSVGSVSIGSTPKGVIVQDRYAYIAVNAANTMQIVDVSNPASPVSVGTVATDTAPLSIFVQGRYAYINTATKIDTFDLGGSYSQQLEAGGLEAGTLQTTSNATIGGDAAVQGGLQVGASAQIGGSLGVNGYATFANSTNATNAFQVQNASSANLFTVDTSNTAIVLGNDGTPSALTVRGGAASGSSVAGTNITFDASNGTGISGSGDFIFRTAAGDNNSVTYDNSAKATDGGGCAVNTLTLSSYTMTANTNRLLLVSVVTNRTVALNSTTGAQWKVGTNTQNMTRLDFGDTSVASPGVHLELWYLTLPTSGSGSVIVNTTGTNTCIEVTAVSYYNVNQTTPFGTEAKTSNNTSPTSNTVTSDTTQLVYDTLGTDNTITGSNVSGNVRQIESNSFMDAAQDKAASSGTTAMGWVDPFADWIEMTVPVNPIVDTNPDTLTDRLHITAAGKIGINNASPQYTLDVAGAARLATTSTTAFQIQNGSNVNVLSVDTSGLKVIVGSGATGEATPSLLVLDSQTGSSSDPTEVDGAMYYNVTTQEYRCGRNGYWENCGLNPIDRGFVVEDEFLGGTTTNIGSLDWTDTQISTADCTRSYNGIAATANRPGSFRATTAATLSTGCLISLNTADMILAAGQTMKSAFSVSSTTNEQVRVGWYAGTAQADPTTSGLWWEAVNGTANWRYCYATGAAATCANSATAVAANSFVRLEIRLTATGSGTSAATFCINGTCSNVSGVTISTATAVQPGFTCTDINSATAISCDIDYYQLRGIASAAR